ncbi:MAG TPA: FkbM family methyltransferase [Actinomycetota bacterium]|nr:FkbM family methyltransferase [Actinomycetota bacterium]
MRRRGDVLLTKLRQRWPYALQAVTRSRMLARYPRIRYRMMVLGKWIGRFVGFPPPQWATLTSGSRILCDLRDHFGAQMFYTGSYSDDEINLLTSTLREGETFVDVGANIGLFSIEVARHLGPAGRVYAFEPAEDTIRLMRMNLRANGVEELVQILPMGLGETSETLLLRAMADAPDDLARRSLYGDGIVVGDVRIASLDELVEREEVVFTGGLHAVKIDVEGAEPSAIRGMRKTLLRYRPRIIVMETDQFNLEYSGSSVDEVHELMASLDYVQHPTARGRNTAYLPREALPS